MLNPSKTVRDNRNEEEDYIAEDSALTGAHDASGNVKNSMANSGRGAVSFVDKTKYGIADPDEAENLAALVDGKTPTTARRIV